MNFFLDFVSSRALRFACGLLVGLNSLVPCAYAVTAHVKNPSLYTRAVTKIKEQFTSAPVVRNTKPRVALSKYEHFAKLTRAQAAVKDEMLLDLTVPIIGSNEWHELQIDWLFDVLDRAQTTFGECALRQLLFPLDDLQEIQRRQAMVKMLVEDDAYYLQVKEALGRIYESEDDVLAYWGESDALAAQAASIYYRLWFQKYSPKIKAVNNYLNNSRKALEAATWIEWFKSSDSFLMSLVKVSIAKEIFKLTMGITDRVDIDTIVGGGLVNIFRSHNPFLCLYNSPCSVRMYLGNGIYKDVMISPYKGDPTHAAYLQQHGSFGDKYAVLTHSVNQGPGGGLYWTSLSKVVNFVGINKLIGYLRSKENYTWDGCIPLLQGESKFKTDDQISLWDKTYAAGVLGVMLVWEDRELWTSGEKFYERAKTLHSTMRDLRARLKNIAGFLQDVNKLERIVEQKDAQSGTSFAPRLKLLTNHAASDKFKELISLLKMPTFKGETSFLYLRGRVLKAHKLCMEIKKELSPAIAAIGELDAYFALATLMRESRYYENGWTFAEFVEGKHPSVDLQGLWIGVINPDVAVPNDIMLGGDEPSKMLITGPNGGGKSTVLKSVGHAVWLGHSWGIVPAKKARLTLFNGIKTCLRSEEDLAHGMSTFMAEKRDMDNLKAFVTYAAEHDKRVLVLIDEPYRGTVDEESAERIYQLGQFVAPLDCVMMMLATHVKKPVSLENDTNRAFANYHAEIREVYDHNNQPKGFKRLFKLERGVADWWFNDAARRSRFIDWLGHVCIAKS